MKRFQGPFLFVYSTATILILPLLFLHCISGIILQNLKYQYTYSSISEFCYSPMLKARRLCTSQGPGKEDYDSNRRLWVHFDNEHFFPLLFIYIWLAGRVSTGSRAWANSCIYSLARSFLLYIPVLWDLFCPIGCSS